MELKSQISAITSSAKVCLLLVGLVDRIGRDGLRGSYTSWAGLCVSCKAGAHRSLALLSCRD